MVFLVDFPHLLHGIFQCSQTATSASEALLSEYKQDEPSHHQHKRPHARFGFTCSWQSMNLLGQCGTRDIAGFTLRGAWDLNRWHTGGSYIRYDEARLSITCDGTGVSVTKIEFFDRINDLLAGLVFIQFFKGIRPVVTLRQRQGLARIFSIRQKLNRYAFRSHAVLVVAVCPGFCHLHARLTKCMGVRHVMSGYLCAILRHCIFRNSIRNECACLILRQVLEAPCPTFLFRHGLCIGLCAVL